MNKVTILLCLWATVAAVVPASSTELPQPEASLPETSLPAHSGRRSTATGSQPRGARDVGRAHSRAPRSRSRRAEGRSRHGARLPQSRQARGGRPSSRERMSTRCGAVYEDGVLVSTEDLARDDAAAWRAEHGALAPGVVTTLAELAPDETVRVGIWPWDENETAPFDSLLPDLMAALEDDAVDADVWSLRAGRCRRGTRLGGSGAPAPAPARGRDRGPSKGAGASVLRRPAGRSGP